MDPQTCKRCGRKFDFDMEGAESPFGGAICGKHDPDLKQSITHGEPKQPICNKNGHCCLDDYKGVERYGRHGKCMRINLAIFGKGEKKK